MIRQINSWWWFKLNGSLRYSLVHIFSSYFPLYIVNEYPKSGGTWVSQMLSKALDCPFPQNRLPMLRPSIIQGHYLRPWNMKNVLVVWRDGRDVVISFYFFSYFTNQQKGNAWIVERTKKRLPFSDYGDIEKNLPLFIEYLFRANKHPKFSWTDFVDVWHGRRGVFSVKYEDLRTNPAHCLQKATKELTGRELEREKCQAIVDEFSFQKQSGREPGVENKNSFLRKGIVGDWQNYFTREARQVFDHYAGEQLIKLGYELDHSWVEHDSLLSKNR